MDPKRWQLIGCGLFPIFTVCMCAIPWLILGTYLNSARQSTANGLTIQILGRYFNAAQLAQGRVIYMQQCATCHGADGQGQFPEAPLKPDITGRIGAPPHNETGHSWHHSDVQLIRYVTDGGFSDPQRFYTMPAFSKILTNEQILLVLAYIKTLWTDQQLVSQRQLTEAEQQLFSN